MKYLKPLGDLWQLMAVPKRKVTPSRRGIRNGPKALKGTPMIVRCKACGKVRLPHFYCCRQAAEGPHPSQQ